MYLNFVTDPKVGIKSFVLFVFKLVKVILKNLAIFVLLYILLLLCGFGGIVMTVESALIRFQNYPKKFLPLSTILAITEQAGEVKYQEKSFYPKMI